jgi:hypothetical protein
MHSAALHFIRNASRDADSGRIVRKFPTTLAAPASSRMRTARTWGPLGTIQA